MCGRRIAEINWGVVRTAVIAIVILVVAFAIAFVAMWWKWPAARGADAVLSRWTVSGCANCQTHLRVSADFPAPAELSEDDLMVLVHTRQGTAGKDGPLDMVSTGQLAKPAQADLQFGVSIRP